MAWIRPKEKNLCAYMAQDEIDAFRQYMGFDPDNDSGMQDPVIDVLNDIATMVRGYCKAKVDKADPFSLPQSLMSSAMVIARYRILTRMSLDVNDARKEDYSRAMEHLSLVAKGDVIVESPDGEEEASARVIPLWGLSFRPNILR